MGGARKEIFQDKVLTCVEAVLLTGSGDKTGISAVRKKMFSC